MTHPPAGGHRRLVFEYMFEYYLSMNHASEPAPDASCKTGASYKANGLHEGNGVLKAMSPGVVDFLFRRLVAGEAAEDVQWHKEGTALSAQLPGAELARRLAETDLEALTPTELFHYVRAAQRLQAWAEALREDAVSRYCALPSPRPGPPSATGQEGRL
jgi:hypothetical protein